ncbi:hypothetical protein ACFRI7_22305 [Streptomyces sp. NPDC056716]|uniref:hypothetical protein n=1 Tax=unclassified Streptomyces TaxID=2593676 RepID=UPI0036C15643
MTAARNQPRGAAGDFDRAVNTGGAHEIHAGARHWMLEAVPDPRAHAIEDRPMREEAGRRGAA